MIKKLEIIFILFFLYATVANAQNINPTDDQVYIEREIMVIRMTMSAEDKAFLLHEDNKYSEVYVPADVTISNSQLDEEVLNVGVRLRGNSSRDHLKKAFKIDFKEFGGGKFHGYKKFNLKPDVNDPTLIRELLTMHLYRLMEVPAQRVTPVQLFMNEEYMGAYLNLEQIDDEFVDSRFGHEDGFLYKCGWGSTLQDNGQVFNTILFESKINEDTDTRAELEQFVKILNNTSDEDFVEEIEKVFSVDRYLRQMAVEALTGHWDGYSYNQNNFYLFYNEQTGLVEFLPYDTDNTWGISWGSRDWATRNLGSFYRAGNPRPLSSRILDVEAYRDTYFDYLRFLFENYFNEEYLYPIFDHYEALLDELIQADTYYSLGFGFSYEDFKSSYDFGKIDHVKYGLRGFLKTRTEYGLEDLPTILGVEDSGYALFPNPSDENRFYLQASTADLEVEVYTIDGRKLATEVNRAGSKKMEVSIRGGIQPGIYLIKIDQQLVKWVKK